MDDTLKQILKELQSQIYDITTVISTLSIEHNHLVDRVVKLEENIEGEERILLYTAIEKNEEVLKGLKRWGNECHANMLRIDPDFQLDS